MEMLIHKLLCCSVSSLFLYKLQTPALSLGLLERLPIFFRFLMSNQWAFDLPKKTIYTGLLQIYSYQRYFI